MDKYQWQVPYRTSSAWKPDYHFPTVVHDGTAANNTVAEPFQGHFREIDMATASTKELEEAALKRHRSALLEPPNYVETCWTVDPDGAVVPCAIEWIDPAHWRPDPLQYRSTEASLVPSKPQSVTSLMAGDVIALQARLRGAGLDDSVPSGLDPSQYVEMISNTSFREAAKHGAANYTGSSNNSDSCLEQAVEFRSSSLVLGDIGEKGSLFLLVYDAFDDAVSLG